MSQVRLMNFQKNSSSHSIQHRSLILALHYLNYLVETPEDQWAHVSPQESFSLCLPYSSLDHGVDPRVFASTFGLTSDSRGQDSLAFHRCSLTKLAQLPLGVWCQPGATRPVWVPRAAAFYCLERQTFMVQLRNVIFVSTYVAPVYQSQYSYAAMNAAASPASQAMRSQAYYPATLMVDILPRKGGRSLRRLHLFDVWKDRFIWLHEDEIGVRMYLVPQSRHPGEEKNGKDNIAGGQKGSNAGIVRYSECMIQVSDLQFNWELGLRNEYSWYTRCDMPAGNWDESPLEITFGQR
ncbi:hypothetical protein C8J56DRAFT_879847 [Mycena floridula]|nr:hypothetical protein C8J56DRAFT_879847 [Mycena floridula]